MDKVLIIIGGIIIAVVLILGLSLLFAFPLMWAWNYVMPYLFGFKVIGFWHSFALLFVASALMKSSSSSSSSK